MTWFRVPEWTVAVNDDATGKKARAWVYLLGAWHSGNDPGPKEIMRATGYGGGMATALIPAVARWAIEVGARLPERWISKMGTIPERSDAGQTPKADEPRNDSGTLADEHGNASRARVPLTRSEEMVGVGTATAPAVETPPDLPALLQGDHATVAALVACRVLTVDDLTRLTMGRLRSIRGIGPKRALTIREALAAHGRDLVVEDLPPARRTVERPGFRNLSDRWCAAFKASTGQEYRWTARGRASDQAAVATLYDVVGWSAEPSEAVVADAGGTVRRYLGECKRMGQVPTLTHMVAQLPRWRQTVDQRTGSMDRRASLLEQFLDGESLSAPTRIVIDTPTKATP